MINSREENNWIEGINKNKSNVRDLLEERVKAFKLIKNFDLSNANLENINLVNTGHHQGYKLHNCDFYKANLSHAHCFKVDFSGSSLMKANFKGANLHFANLQNCNLLGVDFEHARLENVIWDKDIVQERKAKAEVNDEVRIDLYQQSEEIYRNLRRTCESDGLFETAGRFFQKEMKMRRKQMPLFSLKRLISKLVEFSCGYGERPLRIVILSTMVILLFTCIFFISGLDYSGEILQVSVNASMKENIAELLNSLYFSVVTFTTLGYGDILPIGISKVFAGIEALLGGFILALFVVVFVKKMTR
jgi:hypothetical protein